MTAQNDEIQVNTTPQANLSFDPDMPVEGPWVSAVITKEGGEIERLLSQEGEDFWPYILRVAEWAKLTPEHVERIWDDSI